MKTTILFTAIIAVVVGTPTPLLQQQWSSFKITQNKSYTSVEEENKRFTIFKENVAKIDAHNFLYVNGLSTYKLGINQFADWTKNEFLAYVNRFEAPKLTAPRKNIIVPKSKSLGAEFVDWRNNGIVTNVKNQGSCGSCWSFSATGALEGQNALRTGNLISLSEQNLIDCSFSYGNGGCSGGWMDSAFQYVIDNGLDTETNYPYEAIEGSCRYSGQSVVSVYTYYDFSPEPSNVQLAVEQYGPLSVAIDATDNLQFYSSGILVDNTCSADSLNHGVLAVGFGPDYWLVKNSWGDGWGEGGYFKISNQGNACGLTTMSSVPILY